jgi:hypothetical protein
MEINVIQIEDKNFDDFNLNPIERLISKSKLIFSCNKVDESNIDAKFCNKFLFTNNEIKYILKLSNSKICFVLENVSFSNLKLNHKKQFIDNILNQSDCIYQEIQCPTCNNILGRYVISTTEEKINLLDSIIVFSSEVAAFQIQDFDIKKIDLNEHLNSHMSTAIVLNKQLEIYNNICNNIDEVSKLFFKIMDYNNIKESLGKTQQSMKILERFTEYIEYILNTNIN